MSKKKILCKPHNLSLDVWESFLDDRESAQVVGKGWTVCRSKAKLTPYCGYPLRNGKRVRTEFGYPRFKTIEEAARYAITTAHAEGTLNWEKTVLWLKLKRLEVPLPSLQVPKVHTRSKGWYVSRGRSSSGMVYWQITVGKSYRDAVYWCYGGTVKTAFRTAVKMGLKNEPVYNRESTAQWFERNGFPECVDLA